MDSPAPSKHPLAALFEVETMRLRSAAVVHSIDQGLSGYYRLHRDRIGPCAERLAQQLRGADLTALDGSLWGRLDSDGAPRRAELQSHLTTLPALEQGRTLIDLAVLTLLLGGQPGPGWRYNTQSSLPAAAFANAPADDLLAMLDRAAKAPTGAASDESSSDAHAADASAKPAATLSGEAGLAVAAYQAFQAGAFAGQAKTAFTVDAAALRHVDASALRAMLQGSTANPLQGLEARAGVMAQLGHVLQEWRTRAKDPAVFSRATSRPADLLAAWIEPKGAAPAHTEASLDAHVLLAHLLKALTPVWAGGTKAQGLPAGDAWPHRWAGDAAAHFPHTPAGQPDAGTGGYVPLHAVAQKLVVALAWPLSIAGFRLVGVQALGPVADRATTQWILDQGLLVPRQASLLTRTHRLQDEAVVEARAAAVTLLPELAAAVQARLGLSVDVLQLQQFIATQPALGADAAELKVNADGTLF